MGRSEKLIEQRIADPYQSLQIPSTNREYATSCVKPIGNLQRTMIVMGWQKPSQQ